MRAIMLAKYSLIALLVPASLLSLSFFATGVGFGMNLWKADRPFAILLWFAVVLLPLLIVVAIRSVGRPARFRVLLLTVWSFVIFWTYLQLVWQPWTYGGPWGW